MIERLRARLVADPSRVVIRPFNTTWHETTTKSPRAELLLRRVLELDEDDVMRLRAAVLKDFRLRHWQIEHIFSTRFDQVAHAHGFAPGDYTQAQRELAGAYFCHEYSHAAAAIMNPSVTEHPDQSGMAADARRIIIAMRTVGEGHISTIAFKEGIIAGDGSLSLGIDPPFATAATPVAKPGGHGGDTVHVIKNPESTLTGTVLFPVTPAQASGLEDLRLTCFREDDGADCSNGDREWIGTYTAYSGSAIRSELLITRDFKEFTLKPMTGSASVNKGMALFPRRIDGQYMMVGRQDGQNLYLLRSDDYSHWEGGDLLMTPMFPWEYIQIGNCGPPIELDEGWLLLTHGVGAMRKYSIGAALLDKANPSKVLGRSAEPVLTAVEHEREGYVPNVVYTCGAMKVASKIFMPYALADSSVGFAFIDTKELIASLV